MGNEKKEKLQPVSLKKICSLEEGDESRRDLTLFPDRSFFQGEPSPTEFIMREAGVSRE